MLFLPLENQQHKINKPKYTSTYIKFKELYTPIKNTDIIYSY